MKDSSRIRFNRHTVHSFLDVKSRTWELMRYGFSEWMLYQINVAIGTNQCEHIPKYVDLNCFINVAQFGRGRGKSNHFSLSAPFRGSGGVSDGAPAQQAAQNEGVLGVNRRPRQPKTVAMTTVYPYRR